MIRTSGLLNATTIVIILCSPLIFGLLALTQGQDMNWDLLNYHYYTGYSFWTGSWKKDMMPAGLQSYLDPLYNIFIYLSIHNLSPKTVGFVIGALDGLLFAVVFLIAGIFLKNAIQPRVLRVTFQFILALSGAYSPNFLSEIGNSMGDVVTGLFILLGLLLIFLGMEREFRFAWIAGGCCMGIGIGLKLTNSVFFLATICAFLLAGKISPQEIREKALRILSFLIGGAIGVLATGGYWFFALYQRFGNPLFPYYNQIFHSPYALSENSHDYRWFPKTLKEWIFFPFYFTHQHQITELSIENYLFMFIFLLLILYFLRFFFLKLRRLTPSKESCPTHLSGIEQFLLIYFVSAFVLWEIFFSYYRYLAPLEILAPIAFYVLFKNLVPWHPEVVTLCFFIFNAMNPHYPNWGRVSWGPSYFGIRYKKGALPQQALILVGAKPIAFVIPELPKGLNFDYLGNPGGIASKLWFDKLKTQISRERKPIFLLTNTKSLTANSVSLKNYHLGIAREQCVSLKNRGREGILICPLLKKGSRKIWELHPNTAFPPNDVRGSEPLFPASVSAIREGEPYPDLEQGLPGLGRCVWGSDLGHGDSRPAFAPCNDRQYQG